MPKKGRGKKRTQIKYLNKDKKQLAKGSQFKKQMTQVFSAYGQLKLSSKDILSGFDDSEIQALLPTIRMYYRANAGLLKLKEKQFIVTILKLMTVFKRSGNFKGGAGELVPYDSPDEELGEYRGRRSNPMGKLLMILSVALVVYLYWMLFQQIQEDVNSLENSLKLITQSQDRIVDIISDGVDTFFEEVDRKVSQSDILTTGLEGQMTIEEFAKVTPLDLPLAIGSGNDVGNSAGSGMSMMNELTTNMSKQFKHLIALKAGIVQCIYAGWAANGREGAAMAQFGTAATKKFIQSSTQIVTQVITEKSDRIEAFTDKYLGSLDTSLTEAQKKESLVDLLSAFAGSQVSIKARERILGEFESIFTNELMYFITNADTQVKNRVMTDLRIILDRVQRTTGSIYNTLRCIQKVSYAVIILPIMNKFKDRIGERIGEQLGLEDGERYLEDRARGKKKTKRRRLRK